MKKEIVIPFSTLEEVVGDDFLEKIAHQTNIYARAHAKPPNPGSHIQPWHDVDPSKMKLFLGILFCNGVGTQSNL